MLVEAQERGSAATGVMLVSRENAEAKPKVYILRAPLCAKDFVETNEYSSLLDRVNNSTLSIVGHTRAVSGSISGAEDNTNNHPHFYGDIVGVHNGRVINDAKLWARYSGYLQPKSKCDSEIIFALTHRKLLSGSAVEPETALAAALHEVRGWYAVAVVCLKEPGKILLARDREAPLSLGWCGTPEIAVFASRWSYINNSLEDEIRKPLKRYKLAPNQLITLDGDAPSDYSTLLLGKRDLPPSQSIIARAKMLVKYKDDYEVTEGRGKRA